jgi:hypothetical protein
MNVWDVQTGVYKDWNSGHMAWMWKRGQGCDVVTYNGNGATQAQGGQIINHSLGKIPEMIWVKYRDQTYDWQVYHKGLNGGTTPQNYTAPTSTTFTVGDSTTVNYDNGFYLAMLFASVDGISKVGYYTGTGAAGNTQTTGFTPRLIIVKCVTDAVDWGVFDTVRGLGSSGNDERLYLNTDAAQVGGYDYLTTSSTGFTPAFVGSSVVNSSGQKYIYYAHA